MEEQFPVNSGNVPPPAQTANGHQIGYVPTFQTTNRRKQKETLPRSTPKLKLERILGLTSTSSNILATTNDLIAYAAGAVIVIYNPKRNKQVALLYPPPVTQSNSNTNGNLVNIANTNGASTAPLVTPLGSNNILNGDSSQPNPTDEKKSIPVSNRAKPISCLTFSPDGHYLAAGEMGHQPRIFIWDVKEKKLLREFRSHKFGVLSLSFSPNMRYLVSIGFQHDGYIYVWNWKKGTELAGNKVTSRVNAVSFSKDGSYFVTAGLRHVKFWYLDARGRTPKRGNLSSRETQVLDGRSGILGVLRDANFVDVACDQSTTTGYTYFITDTGILCIFKEGRVIDKWVDLQVKSAYSIAVSSNYVICTCSEGIIRLFEPVTLKYAGILPKPHPLGTDISIITSPDMVRSTDKSTFYPDAVAMVYDGKSQRVTVVYSDRSLYVWDIRDLQKIGKYRSFIFHSDCVWGVEPCPTVEREDNAIPLNSFATFSADGTIRIWNLDNPLHLNSSASSSPLPPHNTIISPSSSTTVGLHRRNIYSRELVKMLYVDPNAAEFSKFRNYMDFSEDQCPDFGIRSLKMSSDGQMMASGDRNGNLRVHDMNTWKLLTDQEAHDSEILSIDLTTSNTRGVPSLVATASRDRLLHIFDIQSKFQHVQSLDDHSSSITAVKFCKDASRLISCGADKGIIFRNLTHPVTTSNIVAPRPYLTCHNYSGRSTVFDMALDINGRYIATVTGERKLYVLSVESGKPICICKPETSEEIGKSSENSGGSLINIDLDPFSGTYAVTSGSDRCIRLFDLTNSACIEKICAHSEFITAVKFVRTNNEQDGLRVVSTCSDGTVFIWKVSREIVAKMLARTGEKIQHRQNMVDDIDEKRVMQLAANNAKRFRRISTATAVRPTASISQMIRQGDRKTFSTMSPAEQKYDDLYKKIAASSGRRNRVTDTTETSAAINNNIPPHNQINHTECSSPPSSTHVKFAQTRAPLSRKENNRINTPPQPQNETVNTGRKSPAAERIGKLDRLYNGLPTNGGRDRTISQLTQPTGITQYRQQQQNSLSPNMNSGGGRTNQVLRRALSRDALKKEHDMRRLPNGLASTTKQLHREPAGAISRKTSQPTFVNNRRKSDPQPGASRDRISDTEEPKICKTLPEEESDNDADVDTNKEEEDDEDDEDEDETEEEEEEIIFTPEQDRISKPFEVTTHHDEDDDGRSTPVSDTEVSTITKPEEEEDGSSEDNVDDAINRDIVAREPPRVSTSLSRTTSSVANGNRRRSALMDTLPNTRICSSSPPPVPPIPSQHKDQESIEIPSTAIKEIKKKMEKAAKRYSITARFLSSLYGGKSELDNQVNSRPSLDHIMNSFQEMASKDQPSSATTPDVQTNTSSSWGDHESVVHAPVEKLTIDVAPPIPVEAKASPESPPLPARKASSSLAQESHKLSILPSPSPPPSEAAAEEDNEKLENALADLDGASILLDSVLEIYLSTLKTTQNEKVLSTIESKLSNVAEKISQTVQKQPAAALQNTPPETVDLLEKYSSLLLSMVETKLMNK